MINNPAAPPKLSRLIRSALVVMLGFAATKGVSLLQTIIIAARFGAGSDYDTFAAGSIAPDYIVQIIGGGALGVAFIPIFSGLLNKDDSESAWQLASQVFNTLLLITLSVSLGVIIFAEPLVRHVIASGLNDADIAQTANIMRILSLAAILFTLSGMASAVLHGHNHFLLPVLAPVFQDLGLLFGVIFFLDLFGIYGLAWGTLLGAVLHIGIQLPGLVHFRWRWFRVLGWQDPRLRQVFRLMVPRIGIGLAFVANLVVITNLSSQLGEGAISAFSWGRRFMDIPQALLGTAVGIVIFPTLSALSATGDKEKRLRRFKAALRFILVTCFPAMIGLILVSYDALRLLFDAGDSAIIYTSIQVLSLAIIVQSVHEILTRSFYAEQDTFRPLIFSILGTGVSVLTMLALFEVYRAQFEVTGFELVQGGNAWGFEILRQFHPPLRSFIAVGVPALGYVLVFVVENALLIFYLRRRWGDIALPELTQITLKAALASAVMGLVGWLWHELLFAFGFGDYRVSTILIRILTTIALGMGVFFVMGLVLNISEVRTLPKLIRSRRLALDED